MKYENPSMELILLQSEDVITLSVNNEYDPTIDSDDANGNPWAN